MKIKNLYFFEDRWISIVLPLHLQLFISSTNMYGTSQSKVQSCNDDYLYQLPQ